MNTNELIKKDVSELNKMALDLKEKLSDIRFKFAANQLKNTSEIGNIRKEIARILTIKNQKLNIKNQNDN